MDTTHNTIRSSGGRLTKIRKAIIAILSETCCLLSKQDIAEKLKKSKLTPDRSTLYRELLFLTKNNIIIKNTIADTQYYELPHDHHHHLVCIHCNSIERVPLSNHLKKQEKQIQNQYKFTIINHVLEFYGYCHKCRT